MVGGQYVDGAHVVVGGHEVVGAQVVVGGQVDGTHFLVDADLHFDDEDLKELDLEQFFDDDGGLVLGGV